MGFKIMIMIFHTLLWWEAFACMMLLQSWSSEKWKFWSIFAAAGATLFGWYLWYCYAV